VTRRRELGIAAYLVKPVSASALFEAIRSVLSAAEGEPVGPHVGVVETPERAARSLTVLVADDHSTNRKLATRILQRRGHACLHAADGDEVLEVVGRERVDLVLMDVQMPRRDGFQTTAAIREDERRSGRHLPIIALTAHAMKGDREKCLAAGMDSYLAKPLRAKELIALVERIAEITPENERHEPAAKLASPNVTGTFDAALDRLDGDAELLREQMEFFLSDGPELLQKIKRAIAEADGNQLQLFAHRLRGLVGSFDADEAAELALRLELLGRDGGCGGARELCDRLEGRMRSLIEAMKAYLHPDLRCRPVIDASMPAISSGAPQPTILPPASPPSGPRSIT
jgi:CheY-like chemotaxis protein